MYDVAEGVPTAKAARELSKKMKIEMPITEEVYSVLYEGKDPFKAISSLMQRELKNEQS
jgi:glycerol-3-phosphate dehydrogenase (NAD(P)+)